MGMSLGWWPPCAPPILRPRHRMLVAIPALAGYAIVRNRVDALTAEATLAAEELINQFRPRAPRARSSETAAAPAAPASS